MGVVCRTRDEVLNRDVALKLVAPGTIDKMGRGHLLSEAQTASSLSHPNICTIHQVGQTGDDFYVVMELIDGRSLADLLTATGLSMETVSRYGAQIADALAHAHGRGIAHRDLKGSNVMVTTEGRVVGRNSATREYLCGKRECALHGRTNHASSSRSRSFDCPRDERRLKAESTCSVRPESPPRSSCWS